MWAALVTDTATPQLEFDYFGSDSFEILGKSSDEIQAMSTSERLESRSRQAKRMVRDLFDTPPLGSSFLGTFAVSADVWILEGESKSNGSDGSSVVGDDFRIEQGACLQATLVGCMG